MRGVAGGNLAISKWTPPSVFPARRSGTQFTRDASGAASANVCAVGRTVVLAGYSASGKSCFGQKIRKRFASKGRELEYRDSDEEIGKRCGDGIYACYIGMGYDAALVYIEERERFFLDSLRVSDAPRLVVAGPNLPLRDSHSHWSDFLERVKPIVYYLKVSARMVRSRLADRESDILKAHPELVNDKEFGSWNLGTLRRRDDAGKCILVPKDEAVERIREMMSEQVRRYKGAVTDDRTYDAKNLEKNSERRALADRIQSDLG